MDGISSGNTQQLVGLAVQQSALNTQAGMINKLMEGASAGLQQPQQFQQPQVGLRTDALGERGIGAHLNIVA